MWTGTFFWILIACVLLEAIMAGPPDRKKVLRKEKQDLRKLLKTLDSKTKRWKNSWENSKRLKKIKLTKKQAEYWRKLSEFPEDDEEEVEKRSVHKPEDDLKLLRRTKRSGPMIPRPKRIRREWRHMTTTQKQSFIDAFNEMAAFVPDPREPDITAFRIFVRWHRINNAPGAHRGASFLPWHREFLWRLSNALRLHGYRGDMPYFDSALDQFLPNPRDSALWIADHEGLGINDGQLAAPFNESVTTQITECSGGAIISRTAVSAESAKNFLYTRTKYQTIMNKRCFGTLTQGWDSDMEDFHNTGHSFFGGTMIDASCSPGDPVFWLHHTNVDCLWEEYRQQRQNPGERTLQYPRTNLGNQPENMAWNSLMLPFEDWGLLNIHGLSNHYGSYYYRCEARPSSIICRTNEECVPRQRRGRVVTNPMLWCHRSTGFCVAKIREGRNCTTGWPDEQCYCVNGNANPRCRGTCRC